MFWGDSAAKVMPPINFSQKLIQYREHDNTVG